MPVSKNPSVYSDSSSDDEPIMSSPDNSDNDNDDNDNVFRFHSQKFQKTTKGKHPSSPRRKNHGHKLTSDVKYEELERKERRRGQQQEVRKMQQQQQQQQSQKKGNLIELDSDSDSDIRATETQPAAKKDAKKASVRIEDLSLDSSSANAKSRAKNHKAYYNSSDGSFVMEVYNAPRIVTAAPTHVQRPMTRAAVALAVPQRAPQPILPSLNQSTNRSDKTTTKPNRKQEFLDLLSDSDDEQVSYPRVSLSELKGTMPKGALEALQRSRRAQQQLHQAQLYRAEDVHVTLPTLPVVKPVARRPGISLTAATRRTTTSRTNKHLGPSIRLKCRLKLTNHQQSCGNSTLTEHVCHIRQQEPCQALWTQVIAHYQLDAAKSELSFHFGGEVLKAEKTPLDYGLEQDDLIDGTLFMVKSQAKKKTPTGQKIHLTLRSLAVKTVPKTGCVKEDKMSIGELEPLQVLFDRFLEQNKVQLVSLQFDGEKLDLARTPKFYELETGDLIDAIVAKRVTTKRTAPARRSKRARP